MEKLYLKKIIPAIMHIALLLVFTVISWFNDSYALFAHSTVVLSFITGFQILKPITEKTENSKSKLSDVWNAFLFMGIPVYALKTVLIHNSTSCLLVLLFYTIIEVPLLIVSRTWVGSVKRIMRQNPGCTLEDAVNKLDSNVLKAYGVVVPGNSYIVHEKTRSNMNEKELFVEAYNNDQFPDLFKGTDGYMYYPRGTERYAPPPKPDSGNFLIGWVIKYGAIPVCKENPRLNMEGKLLSEVNKMLQSTDLTDIYSGLLAGDGMLDSDFFKELNMDKDLMDELVNNMRKCIITNTELLRSTKTYNIEGVDISLFREFVNRNKRLNYNKTSDERIMYIDAEQEALS